MRTYRAAVIGCGRMGSKIDDENKYYHFPYPWAHAGAVVEAEGVELVAGADLMQSQLDDFQRRWGVSALYTDFREMLAQEKPDIVCVTTKKEERAEIVNAAAEMGVKAIYATKPMARTLAEADAMIEACRKNGAILAIACHQNWSPWFHACLKAIQDGEIGQLTALVCSRLCGGHNLALFRLFAGAPASWVIGDQVDAGWTGMIGYENGIRGFLTTGGWQNLEFVGSDGWITVRNEYREFEMWRRWPTEPPPKTTTLGGPPMAVPPCRVQFPNPKRPRSSQTAAIEALVENIENGTEPLCPGEWGLEAMEIEIALRVSYQQGTAKVVLPLTDRSLAIESGG
jgi:predicted dehydrogenase